MQQPTEIIVLSDGPANVVEGAWPDRTIDQVTRAELHAFRVNAPKGRVLVCAGGGYLRLMHDREGVEAALWLNGLGYDAYVLAHRLPGAARSDGGVHPLDIALTDGQAALAAIPGDLPRFVLGLSSGGHLAGTLACQPGTDLSGVLIGYAPINANHRDYKAPAGKPDYPPAEKQAFYDAWPIGIAAQPHGVPACPVFLAYALLDEAVPVEHALNFVRTARDLKLDLDAHVFGKAPHGFALRELAGTHGSWPDLAAGWMAKKVG
ncbi:pectin acetylesterase [Caulobacter flavus]|uniref:Pectin acetylesterase n=1 Tax=Caulobacter flavus TaxID=1679497 RepID=A0A2N5CSQ3_9CAUL|nr:prolyl oligopeptidase family serine peptidase [Caulobacter flavus]AYV45657.1 pectin acetylesterase [Caulobacter flavus]PLR13902.1 pectin acetylesterase [Caulobacter flavus]